MIDQNTGSISFDGGELKPRVELSCFLQSELGGRAKKLLQHSEWQNFSVPLGNSFDAVLVFRNDVLVEVRLCKRTAKTTTWASWTEEKEANRKATHDALLAQELGEPPYRYSWGIVESFFDSKGGGSQILIRYL